MDYPKNVANVGLVNGKFVDENTTTGVVGSLIPSEWGNAVTDEILTVIRDAGLEPAEAKTDQLSKAIAAIMAKQATETVQGTAKIATQALTVAGVDDATIVTPKKLLGGFSFLAAANGYLVFPKWLGGFVLQWGTATVEASSTKTVTLPTAFPTECYGVLATFRIPAQSTVNADTLSLSQIRLQSLYSSNAQSTTWFAWGK